MVVTVVDAEFKKSKPRKKDEREIARSNAYVPKLSFLLTACGPALVLEETYVVCSAVLDSEGTFSPDGNCRLSTKGMASGHRFLQLLGGQRLDDLTEKNVKDKCQGGTRCLHVRFEFCRDRC
jgi:hypothetical protein